LGTSADFTFQTLVTAARSILVVSPHPDDDVLIAAGITLAARKQGASIKIAYMTNGDACCSPMGVAIGLTREAEAVQGQAELGVAENNLLFLGYPDSYLATMQSTYPNSNQTLVTSWGQSTTYANRGSGFTSYHNSTFGSPATYNAANAV